MFKVLLFFLVALWLPMAEAKEFKGVNFPDEIKVGETTLKLNGMGLRKAMSFFDVYVGGLYLAEKSDNADAIVSSTTPKRIVLQFMRFVERGKMQDAWKKGFENNAEASYSYGSDLKTLNELMSHLQKDDKITLTFFADHADLEIKDKPLVSIKSSDFSKTLLKVFINNPPDTDLRDGLLGKK